MGGGGWDFALHTYSTDEAATLAAVTDHIPRTRTDLAAGDAADCNATATKRGPYLMAGMQSGAETLRWVGGLVLAAQSLRYEDGLVLQQASSHLTACPRQRVQGRQVQVAGQKGDDTAARQIASGFLKCT